MHKFLAEEYNLMSPARARTQTARSRDERTTHEETGLQKNTRGPVANLQSSTKSQHLPAADRVKENYDAFSFPLRTFALIVSAHPYLAYGG